MALMNILQSNPDLAARIERITEEVKEDKRHLVSAAQSFNKKYESEIAEGTRKKQLLLTEGKKRGLTEDEVLSTFGEFLPAVSTPIMNFLYFLMREEDESAKLKKMTEQFINEFGYQELVNRLNNEFDPNKEITLEDVISEDVKKPKEMINYLYDNITHEMLVRIKKLKALSKSPNEQEAFLAYRKCLELCKKYNLEFDKIPCYVKGQNE